MSIKSIISALVCAMFFSVASAQIREAKIIINTEDGHVIEEGCSGFNVRIADKVWSYDHPDFRKAVHELQPGWLRYFSGTMGDAFNSATGLYDKDYIATLDHSKEFDRGYVYTDVKGPHRITDLYNLLGEVGGKLVVTINGFSETPQIAGELAQFCKNNNIEVEVWQFCNEPYFYVPHRGRYWWNDGYDYAAKMKPYAEAIREVLPDAKLALNCTWDGIWGFMKEIHHYQEEEGAYWDVFSKHSYAPHVGGKESFEKAYRRGNTSVIKATNAAAMQEIEDNTWEDVPMLITEFGVWNRPLNGIFSAIYNVEYTLRQLEHPNAFLIASHEVSNKIRPAVNYNKEITDAYTNNTALATESLITGIKWDDEGKGLRLLHEATNNSVYTWNAKVEGGALVDGLKNKTVDGVYARGFKGISGFDYLVVTNRSAETHLVDIEINGKQLKQDAKRSYMYSKVAQNSNIPVAYDNVSTEKVEVPAYSIVMLQWKSEDHYAPTTPRIYNVERTWKGVELNWWKRDLASHYDVYVGESKDNLRKVMSVQGAANTHVVLDQLEEGRTYYFAVSAINDFGTSAVSASVKLTNALPIQPSIFKVAPHDTCITVMWHSVPDAVGYKVKLQVGEKEKIFDAKNVFGYRISGLKYDEAYQLSVCAYNGLGDGPYSSIKDTKCDTNLPYGPRNISAKETKGGAVLLEWEVNADNTMDSVKYNLYRGNYPHDFTLYKTDILTNTFIDNDLKKKQDYYYTVKSYTEAGECNSYPNVATVIKRSKQVNIEVKSVVRKEDRFVVTVQFDNVKADGDIYYGISYSDVSYLNVEETNITTDEAKNDEFEVEIPFTVLKSGRKYAIKGFVSTNGSPIYSLPPYDKIDF